MHKGSKSILIWLCLFCFFTAPARADKIYRTRVMVIHAGTGPVHMDPGIEGVVREIKPVFKYTSFRMLKQKEMKLAREQEAVLSLPGNRSLVITPAAMKKNRIQYRIRIDAGGKPVFRTDVMLKNHDSVTIGGPRFKKGILLINIRGSSQ